MPSSMTIRDHLTVIWSKILRTSFIYKWWYRDFLMELNYRLERFEFDGDETRQFYKEKLNKLSKIKENHA